MSDDEKRLRYLLGLAVNMRGGCIGEEVHKGEELGVKIDFMQDSIASIEKNLRELWHLRMLK